MGRHRHAVNVRVDGLAVVLGPLLSDSRIRAAVLVDVDSGMVLDAWCAAAAPDSPPDLEILGAQHAEVLRCALALLREWRGGPGAPDVPDDLAAGAAGHGCEVVLGVDGGVRHLVRTVPDPHGDRLALAVVVDGPQRVLDRVRKRLRSVAVDALTAGPTVTRRPVLGRWSFAMPEPDVPAARAAGTPPGPEGTPVPGAVAPGPAGSGAVGSGAVGLATGRSAVPDAPRGGAPAAPPPLAPYRSDRGPGAPPVRGNATPAPPVAALPGTGPGHRPATGPVRRPPGPDRAAARTGSPDATGDRRPSPPVALPAPAPPRQRER